MEEFHGADMIKVRLPETSEPEDHNPPTYHTEQEPEPISCRYHWATCHHIGCTAHMDQKLSTITGTNRFDSNSRKRRTTTQRLAKKRHNDATTRKNASKMRPKCQLTTNPGNKTQRGHPMGKNAKWRASWPVRTACRQDPFTATYAYSTRNPGITLVRS